jgi:hypothetical protein
MPRRNDIPLLLAIGVVLLAPAAQLAGQGIVDCVSPRRVYALRLKGVVIDPTGAPIPNAKLSIEANGKMLGTASSNSDGSFSLKSKPGVYTLKVGLSDAHDVFDPLSVELHSGMSVRTLFRPGQLRVILGIRYMDCTWATTSRKEFEYEIRSNKGRLKESEQNNATQK